jgi:hypothetical protein
MWPHTRQEIPRIEAVPMPTAAALAFALVITHLPRIEE